MQRNHFFDIQHIIRATKIGLLAFFGIYAGLVAYGNLIDPQTNLLFIKHVLSMDTTFQKPELMGRAILSPSLYTASLWLILLTEALICACCLLGSWKLIRVFKSDAEAFHAAKGLGVLGLFIALSLWFLGFQVIGGEWFSSWQSKIWNGFEPAGRIMNYLLGTLIIICMRND